MYAATNCIYNGFKVKKKWNSKKKKSTNWVGESVASDTLEYFSLTTTDSVELKVGFRPWLFYYMYR